MIMEYCELLHKNDLSLFELKERSIDVNIAIIQYCSFYLRSLYIQIF